MFVRTGNCPRRAALLGLWAFLAGPCSGRAREGSAAVVVRRRLHSAEDRALDRGGHQHLDPGHLTVLALRRLVLVDETPDLVEELARDGPGREPGEDAHGGE